MQLDRFHFTADPDQVEQAQAEFSRQSSAVFPRFIAPDLVSRLLRQLESAEWTTKSYPGRTADFGKDLVLPGSHPIVQGLQLLLNNSRLFETIGRITGGPVPLSFMGRLYRHLPDPGHHLDWHDDMGIPGRLIGISVNLSGSAYKGGAFRIRKTGTKRDLAEISHSQPGSAHIFQIGRGWEHSVAPVESDIPRTAFAGWFLSRPGLLDSVAMRLRGR